jgi:hypothetical protein
VPIVGSTAYGASTISNKCIGTLCYSVNIPDSTAQSGSGDIFFQIKGPSTYQWIGMGTGNQMSGSSMFVIYQSSNGQNVTISPRKGSGHDEPGVDSSAKVSLMDGSGISNGEMIANIRCRFQQALLNLSYLHIHRPKLQHFNFQFRICCKQPRTLEIRFYRRRHLTA